MLVSKGLLPPRYRITPHFVLP